MVTNTQIPKGYKQTDKGVIPDDWEMKRLGDIAYITKLAGYEYTKYFNSYRDGGDVVVVRGTNITNNRLDLSDIKTIPRSTSNQLSRSKLSRNDLVFAYVGTIGPVYLIEESEKYHLGPNTCKISADDSVVPAYLYSYFKSWLIENEIVEQTSIGAQPSLSMTKIRSFEFIVPSKKKEQELIAEALNSIDQLLAKLDNLIEKKRNIKQGAMQELLTGKRRLPGFSGKWEEKKMRELSTMSSGGTPLTSIAKYYDGDIAWMVIADITKAGKYISFTEKTITRDGLNNSSAKLFPYQTLFFAMYASIGKCTISTKPMSCNQAILGISVRDVDLEFLYYFLSFCEADFIRMGQTGAQSNLNKEIVGEIKVPYPEKEEQSAISQILRDMDEDINLLEQQRNKYLDLKQGMMQQLLTGKIRLV